MKAVPLKTDLSAVALAKAGKALWKILKQLGV